MCLIAHYFVLTMLIFLYQWCALESIHKNAEAGIHNQILAARTVYGRDENIKIDAWSD